MQRQCPCADAPLSWGQQVGALARLQPVRAVSALFPERYVSRAITLALPACRAIRGAGRCRTSPELRSSHQAARCRVRLALLPAARTYQSCTHAWCAASGCQRATCPWTAAQLGDIPGLAPLLVLLPARTVAGAALHHAPRGALELPASSATQQLGRALRWRAMRLAALLTVRCCRPCTRPAAAACWARLATQPWPPSPPALRRYACECAQKQVRVLCGSLPRSAPNALGLRCAAVHRTRSTVHLADARAPPRQLASTRTTPPSVFTALVRVRARLRRPRGGTSRSPLRQSAATLKAR